MLVCVWFTLTFCPTFRQNNTCKICARSMNGVNTTQTNARATRGAFSLFWFGFSVMHTNTHTPTEYIMHVCCSQCMCEICCKRGKVFSFACCESKLCNLLSRDYLNIADRTGKTGFSNRSIARLQYMCRVFFYCMLLSATTQAHYAVSVRAFKKKRKHSGFYADYCTPLVH